LAGEIFDDERGKEGREEKGRRERIFYASSSRRVSL
jgi:hypothetical protein